MEIRLPYDPAIPLLGIHIKETRIKRDTYTPMFIAAPFTIAKTWKQMDKKDTQWNVTQLGKGTHLSQF